MITWPDFVDLSSNIFEFLIKEHNFKLVSTEQPFVNYDKSCIRISLYYNVNRKGEIDIGIRRLPVPEQFVPLFRLDEFEQLSSYKFPEPPLVEWVLTHEDADNVLNDMASRLKRYCSRTLEGDFSDIDALEIKRH